MQEMPLIINIILLIQGIAPRNISIDSNSDRQKIPRQPQNNQQSSQSLRRFLFGQKSYKWIQYILTQLSKIQIEFISQSNQDRGLNVQLRNKMKLLSILINQLISNLIQKDYQSTKIVCLKIEEQFNYSQQKSIARKFSKIRSFIKSNIICGANLKFGMYLLIEMMNVFYFYLQEIQQILLKTAILEELKHSIKSIFKAASVFQEKILTVSDNIQSQDRNTIFWEFFSYRSKRLNASIVLLIELIGFGNSKVISKENIEQILLLGKYFEIKSTIRRDVLKNGIYNSFDVWKRLFGEERAALDFQRFVVKSLNFIKIEQDLKRNRVFKPGVIDGIDGIVVKYYKEKKIHAAPKL